MVTMMSAAARNRTANALMSKTLPGLDRLVHRITHGRATLFSAMMPTLMLVTTGRRSGLPRRSPLLYVEDGDGHLVVMASNFGQEHHSAWSANLLARPEASVIVEGRETAVRAELLTGSEREELFGDFLRLWAVYQDYAVRSGRELRMFRLTAQRG
jgi:deazaflavin-dependent oxidoreductase (nitroreductase family)